MQSNSCFWKNFFYRNRISQEKNYRNPFNFQDRQPIVITFFLRLRECSLVIFFKMFLRASWTICEKLFFGLMQERTGPKILIEKWTTWGPAKRLGALPIPPPSTVKIFEFISERFVNIEEHNYFVFQNVLNIIFFSF